MRKLLLTAFATFLGWVFFGPEPVVTLGPGIMVAESPKQKTLLNAKKIVIDNYQITPLASFEIKAKILSKESYSLDKESDLSPVDLALGWQKMSDEQVLDKIEISQSGRWYRWRTKTLPIPRREIETQSANMHLIPANDLVEDMIDLAKQGQIIRIKGALVRVDDNSGWHWQSSLTRDDTGAHACEVIYVTEFELVI